ncbi:MAG: electron transport complex subunit RsxC [Candidatus Omnitrophica bacterium]|nr:electron transport complex subunit RsxC [Candidatus Omnitrophota bacterium]
MAYTFYGGAHPSGNKLTYDRPVKKVFIPKKAVIPLSQHTGSPADPVVAVGDSVTVGALVGKSTGFISSNVHASISGKVTRIFYSPTPNLPRVLSVVIEPQGGEDQEFKAARRPDAGSLSKDELLAIIRDAGIVGLGGAAFPAHVKLSPPKGKIIDSVILNGAECEPYLTCDHRLMVEKPKEILRGLALITRILGVKDAYIGIEDNKLAAVYALGQALKSMSGELPGVNVKIVTLKTKYPQGAEKQLIRSILRRTVPAGGLPMDVGCIVHNIGTVFAIYEAVYFSKPLIERVITVTGSCVREPANITVRIGTLIRDIADTLGGFAKEPKKVVVGGPMMGIAQYTMDVPVTKGTSGIVFLSQEDIVRPKESVCIRCGKCIETCPMGLSPTTLMNHVKKEQFSEAKALGIVNCFECGACVYDCPAKIPLLDYMKYGKAKI